LSMRIPPQIPCFLAIIAQHVEEIHKSHVHGFLVLCSVFR
jgi:hypothetical protein